jgi:hypothetical protein
MTLYVWDDERPYTPNVMHAFRPVTPEDITKEMEIRAARVIHSVSDHRWPSGALTKWDDLTGFQVGQFRTQARRVLAAAFHVEDQRA